MGQERLLLLTGELELCSSAGMWRSLLLHPLPFMSCVDDLDMFTSVLVPTSYLPPLPCAFPSLGHSPSWLKICVTTGQADCLLVTFVIGPSHPSVLVDDVVQSSNRQ